MRRGQLLRSLEIPMKAVANVGNTFECTAGDWKQCKSLYNRLEIIDDSSVTLPVH